MKLPFKHLIAFAATTMLFVGSSSAATVINGFALTTSTYAGTADWDAAVQSDLGSAATVASFESIKAAFESDIPSLVTLLAGTAGMVTYNGAKFFTDTRAYFIVYHGASVPGGWSVHDKIGDTSTGNQVSLGSWYDNNKIIAAIPEPSTTVMALLAVLAITARRKR
jgi:hypothetical protein